MDAALSRNLNTHPPRMSIFIKSCNANYNWGDAAMLAAAIERLIEEFSDPEIVLLEPSSCFEGKSDQAHVTSISKPQYASWARERRIWNSLNSTTPEFVDYLSNGWPRLTDAIIRTKMKILGRDPYGRDSFLERFRSADALAVSGGGFVTDVFPEPCENALNLIMLAGQHDIPVFMFGQGIGPLDSPALQKKARRALPHVEYIATREQRSSVPLLHSLGVEQERIIVTGDDAVGTVLSQRSENTGDGIGVNLRVASYSKLSPALYDVLASVLSRASETYDAPLIPVPINYGRSDSDVDSIRQILSRAGVHSDGGANLQSVEDVIQQVARCRVVVTGSYHGGVFALSQGIPVVALSRSNYYDAKFHGLADMFAAGCAVLRTDRPDFESALEETLNESWAQAPSLRPILLKSAAAQQQSSREAYGKMAQHIRRLQDV